MNRTQAVKILKGVTLAGVYGGLLLPLVFIPTVIFPFVFSKLVVFQVIVGLTFPAYLALAWMDREYRPKSHLLLLAILSYFVALALSVIFAMDPLRAWWGNQERMNGLFTLLHFLAWLVMTIGVVKTWEQWRRLLNYEIVLSALMAIVALLQKLNPNLLMFPAGPRIGGLLDNPIYMAAYQIFNLFFLALLFLKVPSKTARWLYAGVAFLDIIAFIMAQSRGALVGLAAGIVAFVFYYAFFTKNKKARYSILAIGLVLFAGYGALFALRNTTFVKETPLARLTDFNATISTRIIAWNIAWEGFIERPLTGWGLDNFHILFNAKYNPSSLRYGAYETWFDRAHNTVLDVLSMTGLIGIITFLSIFVMIFVVTWRAYRRGWIDLPIAAILFSLPLAYFVQNLFVFDHPAGFSMSFLLYALIISATRGEFVGRRDPDEAKPLVAPKIEAHHNAPWTAYGVLTVLMLLVAWRTSILPFRASMLSIKSNAIITSNPAIGLEYAKQAADIWTPYLDEQTFLLSRNIISMNSSGVLQKFPQWQELYALTKKLSDEELTRHPNNTHPHYIYARLLQEMAPTMNSEAPLSEQQYLRAIETSPKRQQLHYGLARLYLMAGQVDAALDIFKRVRDFDTELGEGYWDYGLSLLYDKKDIQGGAEQIVKALEVPYPYQMHDAREILVLTDAYLVMQNASGVRMVVQKLADEPQGDASIYAQLAYKFQLANLPELRDQVLAYAKKIDPNTDAAFQKLLNPQAAPPAAPTPSAAAPTSLVATETTPGSGPRR